MLRAVSTSPRRKSKAPAAISGIFNGSREMSEASPTKGFHAGPEFGSKVYQKRASQSSKPA